jgi:chromosome segregation ATPase
MGWFGDALRVILGLDEEQQAYRQALASAERYLQWSRGEDGERDLEEALRLLEACVPENAPGPHFTCRRERLLTEAHLLLAEAILDELSAAAARIEEHIATAEEGRQAMAVQIDTLRDRTVQLEHEGSLISAREEQRRLEELEREVRALPDLAEDRLARLSAALSKAEPDHRRHREGAARALEAMRGAEGLGKEDRELRDRFSEVFGARLTALDERWKRSAAEFSRPAARPPATKPAAPEGPAPPAEQQGS